MTLIIDGHNLIGVMPDIDLADPDDEWQLLLRLRAYSTGHRRLTVVFDSGAGPTPGWQLSSDHIQVHFAPPGQEADALIMTLLRRSPHPEQLSVVTNDRTLAAMVRAAGGQVRSATQFARRLVPAPDRARTPSPAKPAPDPRDPAFADIYAGFAATDKDGARFGTDIELDADAWLERLYGDDVELAGRAAHWLGRFGGPTALEPLLDALTHSHARVRAAALLALADLGIRQAAGPVADRLAHDSSTLVREAAAQALARLDHPLAQPALEAALSDPKGKVRKAAREGLAQIRARRG